jgi:hypothetical protein
VPFTAGNHTVSEDAHEEEEDSCEEEEGAVVANTPAENEEHTPTLDPWIANPAWKARANSPGKCRAKSKVWERVKRLAADHPMSTTHTHVCLVKNCTNPFMKLLKAPKKDYFTTTRATAHFTKFHIDMDDDEVMTCIKAVKSIQESHKA